MIKVARVISQAWVITLALALPNNIAGWFVYPAMGLEPITATVASPVKSPVASPLKTTVKITGAANNFTCPQDLQNLTTLLLRDLPSYTNRVIQRSRRLNLETTNSYIIIAGNPDFNPINTDINPPPSAEVNTQSPNRELQQVFFTTLNREYQGSRFVDLQEFHRLFLVQTSRGWQLALMYSRSSSQSPQILTPPRESINSAVGQAVSTWLRDCQAGTIRNHE